MVKCRRVAMDQQRLIKKVLKIAAYIFVSIFVFNFVFIALRERYELQGCVLCIDQFKQNV
jgi:hypothetical protein